MQELRDEGVLICGHGSREGEAVREFADFARTLAGQLAPLPVEHAFLEFARPTIAEGLDALVKRGVRRVRALPLLLFAAGHVKNDIPSVLNEYRARHKDIDIRYGRELGIDPKLLRAATARIEEAIALADARLGPVARADTLLLTVGRGASDPDANSEVAKIGRLLWEGLGLGWGEVAYTGVTFPLVAPALARVQALGFRRIVVFPYFLFTGVLVARINAASEAARTEAGPQIVTARYLGDHPLVVETALERISDIDAGRTAMNCSLCKYREAMPGFEDEVGLPQEAHHLHVEGGAHAHGHGHSHHHPYPHASHPFGPASLARRGRA